MRKTVYALLDSALFRASTNILRGGARDDLYHALLKARGERRNHVQNVMTHERPMTNNQIEQDRQLLFLVLGKHFQICENTEKRLNARSPCQNFM